ncbi:MAG: hypothetical protein WA931_11295, partial [Rhodococcus sp. (in: high G+C Gram-positive bacteria)]
MHSCTTHGADRIRVFVPWWVIDDGSFPQASAGDDVEVFVVALTGTHSRLDQRISAIARPAYGRRPQQLSDGRFRWWHQLYGGGWNAGWWSEHPRIGRVEEVGYFCAELGGDRDAPYALRGRVTRVQVVDQHHDRMADGGWSAATGTEELVRVDTVPSGFYRTRVADDVDSFVGPTGVLVELELADGIESPRRFAAGAVSIDHDVVWVMHCSEPRLLRIDASGRVVEFELPMTIDTPWDRWTRRVLATPDGCWITGQHDIHRVLVTAADAVSIERHCRTGSSTSVVLDGAVYLVGSTTAMLMDDRRYGLIPSVVETHPVRVYDEEQRAVRVVDDPTLMFEVRARVPRADRATAPDGSTWWVWLGPQVEVQCLCEFRVREWTQEEIHESWHADTPPSRSSPKSG